MKLGIIVESFRLPFREAVKKAAELGADGIQMYCTKGENSPEELFGNPQSPRLQTFLSKVL